MDYRVIEEQTKFSLEHEVKKMIEQGWEPIGNLSVTSTKDWLTGIETKYCQAMVKRTSNDSDTND